MKRVLKKVVGALALSAAMIGGAQAALLSDLLNGGSIVAGDKLFDQWTFDFVDSSDPAFEIFAADITVDALNDGGDDPGPGLVFTFAERSAGVTGDGTFALTDAMLGFRVSSVIGKQIVGVSMTDFFGELELGGGGVDMIATVVETITGSGGALLGMIDVTESFLDGVEDYKGSDSVTFAPQNEIFVSKNIGIWSQAEGDGIWISTFSQRFSQQAVPEPGSLALAALALAGLGVAARRRRAVTMPS